MIDALAQHVTTGFAQVDARFDAAETHMATKQQVNAIYDLLDKNISEHEKQEVERAAMAHQLNQLDAWVHQLAERVGVDLQRQV